jgi:hypothetical protein
MMRCRSMSLRTPRDRLTRIELWHGRVMSWRWPPQRLLRCRCSSRLGGATNLMCWRPGFLPGRRTFRQRGAFPSSPCHTLRASDFHHPQIATMAEPSNAERDEQLRAGLRRISSRRRDGKPPETKPLEVPVHATPVKNTSGATVAFHWTAPRDEPMRARSPIRRLGAGSRPRAALPRRSARGGRPAGRGATSSAPSRDGPDSDEPEPTSGPFDPLPPVPATRGQLQLWPEPRR